MVSPLTAGVSSRACVKSPLKSGETASVNCRDRAHANFKGEEGNKLPSYQKWNGSDVGL